MMRLLASIALFLFLWTVEESFLSAWPIPGRYTPLLFASAVYLIQHVGSRTGVGWLIGYGFLLDFWQLGVIPGETILLLVVGVVTWILSRRLFTNRSFYGVVACSFSSWIFWQLLTATTLIITYRKNLDLVPWLAYRDFLLWQCLLLFGLMILFFSLAGRIRRTLRHIIMIPSSHETL